MPKILGFGDKLRHLRRSRGLLQKDVADALASRQRRLLAGVGIDGRHLRMGGVGPAESGSCSTLAGTVGTGHRGLLFLSQTCY